MPDDFDDLLLPLWRTADRVNWVDPLAVRRRGQERARHRAIAGGLAVLLAVGLGAGSAWALGRPDAGPDLPTDPSPSVTEPTPGPTESPTPTPPPTEPLPTETVVPTEPAGPQFKGAPIPASAMLQLADVPAGWSTSDALEGDDHGNIRMLISYCGQTTYTDAGQHVTKIAKRSLGAGDGQRYILQQAERYEGGWAAEYVRDIRAVLPKCRTINNRSPGDESTLTVVASGFAGSESVLVKEVRRGPNENFTSYHAVVSQGDVLTTLRMHVAGLTDATARDIARKAATRLCAATTAC